MIVNPLAVMSEHPWGVSDAVFRGGSWGDTVRSSSSARRRGALFRFHPGARSALATGFRLSLTQTMSTAKAVKQ